jgi:hypothetical protein
VPIVAERFLKAYIPGDMKDNQALWFKKPRRGHTASSLQIIKPYIHGFGVEYAPIKHRHKPTARR